MSSASPAADAAAPSRALRRFLANIPDGQHLWLAFSGGLDSTVLLHALASLRNEFSFRLTALHINHGLSPQAAAWSERCEQFCRKRQIPFKSIAVDASAQAGEGPEAAARHARYRAFEGELEAGEWLLTAHHQDDQAETLLLQLMRGGGVAGLAAMPASRPLGHGALQRPLLEVSRSSLVSYAHQHELEWIDDPSNFDTSLERNWVRHELLPQLERRRNGIRRVLARSALHFGESDELLRELAAGDRFTCLSKGGNNLSVAALNRLNPARCRNLLREEIRRHGLPLPTHAQLEQLRCELLTAAIDASPKVAWPGGEARRFRDHLYLMSPLDPPCSYQLAWDGAGPLVLPGNLGWLELQRHLGEGIALHWLEGGMLEVQSRQGGERCRLAGTDHHRPVKKLLQEAGIPPWLRERLPLLYINGELAAIPGLGTCHPFAVKQGQTGLMANFIPSGR